MNTLWHFFYLMILDVAETACYMLLFSGALKRKPHFGLRVAVYFLFAAFITMAIVAPIYMVWAYWLDYTSDVLPTLAISLIMNLSVFIMSTGMMFFLFDERAATIIYVIVVGKSSLNISKAIYYILITATDTYGIYVALIDRGNWLTWVSYFLIHAVVLGLTWLVFVTRFADYKENLGKNLNIYLLAVFFFMLSAMIIFDGCISVYGGLSASVKYIFYSMEFLFSLAILVIEWFIFSWIKTFQEKNAIAVQYESYKRQSELTRRSMEIINIKCHDLKHQIGGMLSGKNVDEGFVKELQDAISIYDTNISTGYEELDLLLMEKAAYCEINKIQLSIMLDGASLKFMPVGDINSFFGNAIDNAVEYLLTVDEKDRFVRVSSLRRGSLFTVRVENFFAGESIQLDQSGFPLTSKGDSVNHGFGVRSIKNVTEKYKGVLNYGVEDGMFVLSAGFFEVNQ